ncbi:hypothetical protein J2045_003492 [Peteryoungia aggregata LMG 23059]|uniref:Uncharacterized protein n=1 Tax=Peteryoungia aggregata LMG 23059 TaxID=1368425 RepID=A0ABU0GAR4_9HYPH|nr:hypothetical protein [Peteryoungia aggregata]MDQ0422444.1 hypothetical protein [Peteryoungia aggregata LMG 23059]
MEIRQVLPESYNQFAGPIEADRELWTNFDQTSAVMQEIGRLVVMAGLQDVLCLRLLHRHHLLEPGVMMLEFEARAAGGRALITAPAPREAASDVLPNMLAVTDFGLASAEYSRTSVFTSPERIAEILEQQTVLAAIRKLIMAAELQSVLAIGFRNKTFFDAGDVGAMMIEVTDEAKGQSIITWEPAGDIGKVIETLWGFEPRLAGEADEGGEDTPKPSEDIGSGTPVMSCAVRCFVGCREVEGIHKATGHEAHHLGMPENKPKPKPKPDNASDTPPLWQ